MMRIILPGSPAVSQPPEPVLPGLSARLVALLAAAAAPDRLALVGGAVRDLLRHQLHNDPWTGLPDLDLVVEGRGGREPEPGPRPAPEHRSPLPAAALAGQRSPQLRPEHPGRAGTDASASLRDDGQRATGVSARDGRAAVESTRRDPEAPACVQARPGLEAWEPPTALPAAHRLARRLRQRLGPDAVPYYQEHAAYGTVELELDFDDGGALLLDVATARRETYPQAGRNPQVRFARLEDDLARRDFTINAMALVLTGAGADQRQPGLPPGLLDPYGGRDDLRARRLRFLHPQSLRDDPTRVLRAARYAARMGFELAPESQAQLCAALAAWPWPWRPGDPPGAAPPALGTRLRMELELLLEREAWPRGLAALQRWGGLALLDGSLQADRHWHRRLRWARRLGLPLLPSLLAVASDPVALAERLQLPHRQHRLLVGFVQLRRCLADLEGEGSGGQPGWIGWGAERWCALLEEPGRAAEAVALALAAALGPRRPLLRWWLRWRHLPATLTAAQLLAAGMKPGPELGERLRRSRLERLSGERS